MEKYKRLIAYGILIFIIILYFFYPSPFLIMAIFALGTGLFINSNFWIKRREKAKRNRKQNKPDNKQLHKPKPRSSQNKKRK